MDADPTDELTDEERAEVAAFLLAGGPGWWIARLARCPKCEQWRWARNEDRETGHRSFRYEPCAFHYTLSIWLRTGASEKDRKAWVKFGQ